MAGCDELFLISILHQTTTGIPAKCTADTLFLISILHQTTTQKQHHSSAERCFLFQFYIKPQLEQIYAHFGVSCFLFQFYIKPQQLNCTGSIEARCFLFQFYIKPQLSLIRMKYMAVVSYFNSTSNHNLGYAICWLSFGYVAEWTVRTAHDRPGKPEWCRFCISKILFVKGWMYEPCKEPIHVCEIVRLRQI